MRGGMLDPSLNRVVTARVVSVGGGIGQIPTVSFVRVLARLRSRKSIAIANLDSLPLGA
jgi:hypothetical protein